MTEHLLTKYLNQLFTWTVYSWVLFYLHVVV